MSAGSSKVCDSTEDLKYDIAVKFDGGDYVTAVMKEIIAGTFKEGDIKQFKVGVDPEPGAVICNATPDSRRRWTPCTSRSHRVISPTSSARSTP